MAYTPLKLDGIEIINIFNKDGEQTIATTGDQGIVVSGKIQGTELEGTSLDINGSADISGSLTGLNGSLTTTANYFQLNTPSGYIQIGAMNTSHAHIYTDRASFYTNKPILVSGDTVLTSASGVMLSGTQTITGVKNFSAEILFDAGFKSDSILLNGAQNFDNISRSGFYNLYNTQTSSTNSPPLTYGTMIVVGGNKQNSSFGLQIAHERTGTGMYVRGMNDTASAWSAWAEIWTSTTDGSGSGLDADLLDGNHASAFAPSSVVNQTDFVSAANGGTFAGSVNVHGNISLTGAATTSNQSRTIHFTGFDKEGTTDFSDAAFIRHTTNVGGHSGSVLQFSSQNDAADGIAFTTNASAPLKWNNHEIWTAGNDGSGSGLDADTLDGQHASAFQAAGSYAAGSHNHDSTYVNVTGDTMTGDLTVEGNLTIGKDGTTPLLDIMFDDHASGSGWDTRIQMGKSDDFVATTVFPTYVPAGAYGVQFQANSDGVFFGMEEYTTGHYRPIIQWGDDDADTPFRIKHENGSEFTVSYNGVATATTRLSAPTLYSTVATGTAPLTVTSTTLVNNLNADLLDGNHASAFALSSHNHGLSAITDKYNATTGIISAASAGTPGLSSQILFADTGGHNKISLSSFYGLNKPHLTIESSGGTDNYYITCKESTTQRLTIYENSNNIWFNAGGHIGIRPRLLGGTGNLLLSGGSSFIVHKSQTPYDETTQGQDIGAIHLDPNNTTNNAGASITWGASDSPTDAGSNAQAGIYVRSDGSYGTKMYLSTTDVYNSGSKTALKIDHSGNVTVTRGNFYLGNVDTGTDNTVLILNGSTLEVEKRENVFAVSAGAGIHGGATSGTATINLDIDGTNNYINMNNTYTPTTSDLIPFSDVSDGTGNGDNNVVRKATIGTILGLASASTPSNMVTTNTTQTISGTKTFSSVPYFNNSSVNARFSYTAGSQGIQIEDSSTTRQTFRCDSSYLRFWMGGSSGSNETLTIAKTGRVGINDGTPDYTLDVYGNVSNISIYASHDIAAYSDARVKDEIETIPNALDKVNKLRGVTFVRTDEGSTDKRMMGVIAQEVKDILPEVVNERESDGHYSVSYGNMVGVLIEAIKELKAEVEELKGGDKCKCKN